MYMKRILLIATLALMAWSCADKPFVIVQIADAQFGFTAADRSQREGTEYVNDLTFEMDCLSRAVEMINEMKPDVVVFTGDQVNRHDDAQQWDAFAQTISSIDPSVKVLHIPGNHDVMISEGNVDNSTFTDRYASDRFVYVGRGVRLVGINSNLIKYNDPGEEAQIQWMRESLAKDSENEVSLLFSHHPFFLQEITEDDGYFQIQKAKRQGYFDLCSELDVDALYAGHLHNNSEGDYNGLPVRTTTSVAFQIGPEQPSIRIITIGDQGVKDELINI